MNNVAMLIDWENIKASAINSLRTPPDIITLKKIARKYGSLRVARAYANWTDSGGWHAGDAERLSAQGIEPVFVATKHFNGEYEKDLVDLRLACDGMELLSMHPEIECFVIVSGDGALETLLSKLSARGKRVVATRKAVSGLVTESHFFPNEGHVLQQQANIDTRHREIASFFKRNLAP